MKTAITYIITAVWLISPLYIHEITASSLAEEQNVHPTLVKVEDFELILLDGGDVIITWTSTKEIRNYFWTVEYQRPGESWKVVETIAGAGKSNIDLNYQVTHKNNNLYPVYYRLLDGQGNIIVGDDMDI